MDGWSPAETLRLIGEHGITHSHMVPTMFHRLLSLPDEVRAAADVSSLRTVLHGAAPCPVRVKQAIIDWWGPVLLEYWGSTEGGVFTLVDSNDWLTKPGTVGKPWPISEIGIFDDYGNRLGPGEIGTVYMRMSTGQFEYYKDKEKTEANRRNGFFTVGDVGLLDEDGWLFLRDRKSDMIISGGVNIYPAEIEGELLTHPKVGDAAVFGIPHEDWGEEVKAVIEPADGVEPGPELEEELRAHLRDRVAGYKVPRSIDFMASLPRDPNGKLYKRRLRDPYWADRERAI
jgi:long-chain acyl-CoA synthetase